MIIGKPPNAASFVFANILHSPYSTQSPKIDRDVSRLLFLDANKNTEMVPVAETKLRVNYFKGKDKSQWHCGIPTSQAVLYKSLYKNIDLKIYGIEKEIEYDWIVKPGGNPKDIRFEYKGGLGTVRVFVVLLNHPAAIFPNIETKECTVPVIQL